MFLCIVKGRQTFPAAGVLAGEDSKIFSKKQQEELANPVLTSQIIFTIYYFILYVLRYHSRIHIHPCTYVFFPDILT